MTTWRWSAIGTLCAVAAAQTAPPERPAAKAEGSAPITVRFRGWLPGSIDPESSGRHRIEFRIYRSPQGGEPIWREVRTVTVSAGRIDVALGSVEPIPMAVHEATFKFLGASVGGRREVYPRYPIVNVVYVSPKAAVVEAERSSAKPRLGPARPAATWAEALAAARTAGRDLPEYHAWYADLPRADKRTVVERAGHYEWVLPWVYDTASHGDYNRFFRGRFQGCDYMDLSPEKRYVFRTQVEPAPKSKTSK